MNYDPLRNSPMSFQEWKDSFDVSKEDQENLSHAAAMLRKSPIFERVLARIEVKALGAMKDSPLGDLEGVHLSRAVIFAVDAIRNQMRVMAEESDYDRKNLDT